MFPLQAGLDQERFGSLRRASIRQLPQQVLHQRNFALNHVLLPLQGLLVLVRRKEGFLGFRLVTLNRHSCDVPGQLARFVRGWAAGEHLDIDRPTPRHRRFDDVSADCARRSHPLYRRVDALQVLREGVRVFERLSRDAADLDPHLRLIDGRDHQGDSQAGQRPEQCGRANGPLPLQDPTQLTRQIERGGFKKLGHRQVERYLTEVSRHDEDLTEQEEALSDNPSGFYVALQPRSSRRPQDSAASDPLKPNSSDTLNEMIESLRGAGPETLPSDFWNSLNRLNLEQLADFGFENFKRTIARNYFTWVVSPRDEQVRYLVRQLPLHATASAACHALLGGTHPPISLKHSLYYNFLTYLLWEFVWRRPGSSR